jgi:hypothetical protein
MTQGADPKSTSGDRAPRSALTPPPGSARPDWGERLRITLAAREQAARAHQDRGTPSSFGPPATRRSAL